jgi:hypothetical protein
MTTSNLFAASKKFVPIATESGTQSCQCRQTRIICTRFNTPKITGTDANSFGKLFLGQIPSRAHPGDVSPETFSQWTDIIRFARGHRAILPKRHKPNRMLYILRRFCLISPRPLFACSQAVLTSNVKCTENLRESQAEQHFTKFCVALAATNRRAHGRAPAGSKELQPAKN